MKKNLAHWLLLFLSALSIAMIVSCKDKGNDVDSTAPTIPNDVDSTAPTMPSGLLVSALSPTDTRFISTQINLTWNPSSDNVAVVGYKVYRGSAYLKTVTGTSTSDPDLPHETSYCYMVSAFDAMNNESPQSTSSCATTAALVTTASFSIPDTGQTQDYTATFGEDSDYTIKPPSFTDNGNGTVTDNVTNLMWQKQDDAVLKDWINAITYCPNLTLAGYTDWRLPTITALMYIVNFGNYSPAINTIYFPNTSSSGYWTSTTDGFQGTLGAWVVDFSKGVISNLSGGGSNYVRCVRGGP